MHTERIRCGPRRLPGVSPIVVRLAVWQLEQSGISFRVDELGHVHAWPSSRLSRAARQFLVGCAHDVRDVLRERVS